MAIAGRSSPLEFTLNGRPVSIESPERGQTLLDYVRASGLTGAKEGCAEGECGACAVAIVVDEGGRSAYRAVNSCLIGLPQAAGHEIYTVESLARESGLADAQHAMAAAGGSQCGYCTPGFVVSLFVEQYRPDRNGPCDPMALGGNLCRCTGYRPIRDAVSTIGPPPPGAFLERLDRPAPKLGSCKLDGFSRPGSVDEAVTLLSELPDATLVSGNTDLGVEANLRERRFEHLVSLDGIPELATMTVSDEAIVIGASMTLAAIGRQWAGAPAFLVEWLDLFASPLIRNRATLGGNLATASPIGDAAPLLLALDARVSIAGAGGRRTEPLSSFFTAYRRTTLRPDEILTAIEIPKPLPEIVRFYKVAKRRMDDISTVAAAIAMTRDEAGRIRHARFAFGGVAATPVRITDAESLVAGELMTPALADRVGESLDRAIAPMSDHRGSMAYRLEVSKSLVRKFWWESAS